MVTKPPNRNLSDQATPWGRWVEDNIQGLQTSDDQQTQGLQNGLKAINGSIQALTSQTVTQSSYINNQSIPFYGVNYGPAVYTPEIRIPDWATRCTATLSVLLGNGESGTIWPAWGADIKIEWYNPSWGGWLSANLLGGGRIYIPADFPNGSSSGVTTFSYPDPGTELTQGWGPLLPGTSVRGCVQNAAPYTTSGTSTYAIISASLNCSYNR